MILAVAQLTPSGRPVLQQGEVEVSLLDKVDIEFQLIGGLVGQQAECYKNGYVILTNRRLIWVDAGPATGNEGALTASAMPAASGLSGGARAASLPLAAVVACHKKVQYSLKGAKVRLVLEVYTDRQRQPVPASGFHMSIDQLGLRCRGPAPDTFKAQLDEQVRQAVADDSTSVGSQVSHVPEYNSGGGGGAGSASTSVEQLDILFSPLRAGLQQRNPQIMESSSLKGGGPGGAPSAATPVSGIQSPVADVQPDPVWLQLMVMEMGFPRNRAARSLLATQNRGVQEAIDYLLAFGDQPGMDDPFDQQPHITRPAAALQTSSATWTTALPSPPSLDFSSRLYPQILPQSGAAAALLPYSTLLSGSESGVQGTASPMGSGSASLAPQQPKHTSLHQQALLYPYSSLPELGGSSAGSPSSLSLAPTSNGSLDVAGGQLRTIGVAGIVKREQQKTAESGRAVEQAFRDLSALMSSAATMVALAEKFRGVLGVDSAASITVGASGPGGEDPLLIDIETQQQLIALGISSPVTRGTAGARYHIELSRQLADFLATPLQRVGGLMSLPDVYCLFNRARGTELVSPDDLLQAAKLFVRAGVQGLRLRPLSSGVLVIQGPEHSEEQVCAKIALLTTPPALPSTEPASQSGPDSSDVPPTHGEGGPWPLLGPGLSANDVALALGGISVTIAAEHLLIAEARGVVCRDDGPEGLRFYRNFFRQDRLDSAGLMSC